MSFANWVMMGVQVVCTVIVGFAGFFFKRELNRVESVITEVSELRTKLAEEYVRKDDYNRTNGEIQRKLDKMMDMLFEMNKNLNGGRYGKFEK